MRFMVDSTSINDDPLTTQLVAYYVDGIYAANIPAVIARFPNSVLVPISAVGTDRGIVGDVEPGCMTIPQAVSWVQRRRAAGFDPTLYVNQTYGWAPARAAFHAAGVPEPHWWVANYDGIAQVPPGAVAKQYANPTLTHGHFDLSVVVDFWPGVDYLAGGSTHSVGGFLMALSDADQTLALALIKDNHAALARIEKVLGTVAKNPDGTYSALPDGELPNYLGWSRDIKNRIETIQQAPAIGAEHTTPPGP